MDVLGGTAHIHRRQYIVVDYQVLAAAILHYLTVEKPFIRLRDRWL